MPTDDCKTIAESAAEETDLTKKGIAFNRASQCYKKNDEKDQFKVMKEKAISAFHKKADKTKDPYEKSLFHSYEALCWIGLEEVEKAKALAEKAFKLNDKGPKSKVPPIVIFTKYLTNKQVEKAEELWKNLHQNFSLGLVELLEEAFITINPSSEPPHIEKMIPFSLKWNALLAGKDPEDPNKDWTLIFYDTSEILDEELVLKKEYLEELFSIIKEQKQYHFLRNIRTITSLEGEDFSDKALFIILATSSEKTLKFGVLLGTLQDGEVHIIAVWPSAFAQAAFRDKNLINAFLIRGVKNPEWFSDLNLLAFLDSEDQLTEGEVSEEKEGLPGYYT